MIFPKTYAEVMRQLDINSLPEPLFTQYHTIPAVKEWLDLADRVRRAEKVSSWTHWTSAESAAYKSADWRLFSRLRGYSELEINDFEQLMKKCQEVDGLMWDGFCCEAEFAMVNLVRTAEYDLIEGALRGLSNAAVANRK